MGELDSILCWAEFGVFEEKVLYGIIRGVGSTPLQIVIQAAPV